MAYVWGVEDSPTIKEYKDSLRSVIKTDFEPSDLSSSVVDGIWTKDVDGLVQTYTIYLCVISQQRITRQELKQVRKDVKSKVHNKRSTSRIPGVDLVNNLGHQPHIIYVGLTDEVIPDTADFIHNQKGVVEWQKYLQEFFVVDVGNEEILQKMGKNQVQSRADEMMEYFEKAH